MTENKNRIAGLDLCKLLGAILVIYYHLVFPYPPDVVSPGFRLGYVPYMLSAGMSICVPLFFASSGALTLRKDADLGGNIRRCIHLFFLLVFWALFSLGLILLMRGQWYGVKEFILILRDLRVGYIQHLWYMPSFLMLILLAPVFQALRKQNRKVLYYFTCVIFLFTFGDKLLNDAEYVARWVFGKTGYSGYRSFFGYTNFFVYHYWYMFVYFVLGYVLLEKREDLRKYKKWVILSIPLMLLCLGVIAVARSKVRLEVFDPVFNNYQSPFTLVLTSAVILLLLWWEPPKWLVKLAGSLSQVSLGVYLIHWLLIEAVKSFLPALMGNHAAAPVLTVMIFILSYLISLGISKVPAARKLIQPK